MTKTTVHSQRHFRSLVLLITVAILCFICAGVFIFSAPDQRNLLAEQFSPSAEFESPPQAQVDIASAAIHKNLKTNETSYAICALLPTAKSRCKAFISQGSYDVYPPKSQDVVKCHGGSMVKPFTEEEIRKQWEDRKKVIVQAAAADTVDNNSGSDDTKSINDAYLTGLAIEELLKSNITSKLRRTFSLDEGKAAPRDTTFLAQVLHGGISPANMASQQVYLKELFGLNETFEAIEMSTRLSAKDMMDSEDFIQWKLQKLEQLRSEGRISISPPKTLDGGPEDYRQLVQRITIHPDTVFVELGTGAGTVLYSMCPPDPFGLRVACLGSDIVRAFVAGSVSSATHLRLTEGYGFPSLPAGTATHLMSHGIAPAICEECFCGHIAEGLRLLRPNGTLLIWMIRTNHHNNNMDPLYFNGTYYGPDMGVFPTSEETKTYFFMDKCRYKYGIDLSPLVDHVDILLDYPTTAYAACWDRDGFFGVRLRRSETPSPGESTQDSKSAQFPTTPSKFMQMSSEDQLAQLQKNPDLGHLLSPADICLLASKPEVYQNALSVIRSARPNDKRGEITHKNKATRRPSLPLAYLSPLMQTWILDLILNEQMVLKRSTATANQPNKNPPHPSLAQEWAFIRIVDDMIYERLARIHHAAQLTSKCKKSKKIKYWCKKIGGAVEPIKKPVIPCDQ